MMITSYSLLPMNRFSLWLASIKFVGSQEEKKKKLKAYCESMMHAINIVSDDDDGRKREGSIFIFYFLKEKGSGSSSSHRHLGALLLI